MSTKWDHVYLADGLWLIAYGKDSRSGAAPIVQGKG